MNRYNIGDVVVYGSVGLCDVVDLKREEVGGVEYEYYVLAEHFSRGTSLTYVPTANERLVSNMRPLMAYSEAVALIESIPSIEPIEWMPDNRRRTEYFKAILDSGNKPLMVGMIKAIILMGKERERIGKKNFMTDENTLAKAKRLLLSELSVATATPECELEIDFN